MQREGSSTNRPPCFILAVKNGLPKCCKCIYLSHIDVVYFSKAYALRHYKWLQVEIAETNKNRRHSNN